MSSKSNYTDLKMSQKEKKLKDYRNRVNSLSNSPRKPCDLSIVEKRRCVSESNASMNGIASLGATNSPSPTPSNPQSPSWDLAKLAHDSESLAQSVAKELQKAESLKNGGLVAWIRKWSRKKQIGKVMAMFEELLPKLQNTEEEVRLWLTALAEKKEATLVESTTMLKDMETSIGVYESYVDFYDELINDCLKISLDVSRELSDLRIAGSLNEELVPLLAAETARQGCCTDLNEQLGDIKDESDKSLDVSTACLCPAGTSNEESAVKQISPHTSPNAPLTRKTAPISVSPPVSCPGSPTILSSKRFSPGPVPEAHNAGPAVWHGIKGSNMKRHMHVNFLIDVPPASLMPVQADISTLSLPPEDIARPSLSPSLAPMIAPRSPPLPDMSMTMSLAPQKSEDILNAIHALQLPESHYNSEKAEKNEYKSISIFENKAFDFSDNTSSDVRGNNMSDTDSNVGYNRDMNRDMNINMNMNMNRDMSREREREDQTAHRSRIDDQLEARIFSAENITESSDARPLNSAKCTTSQPYVTTPTVAANYGPYGGPSFGPFEGPVFGFNAAPDRWSELGSGTPTPGPSVGTPRGAEYSTPMGLQFYSPFWSQLQYQADDVFARSYMVTKLQVESDRWSGRWHNVGSPGAGAVPCNNSACPSMGHTIEVMNMPSVKTEEGNAGLTGVTGVTGFGLSLMHPHDCSFRAHERHDMLSPDMVIHNNNNRNQLQLQPQLQRDDSTMHASVLSSTGASTDIGGKNDDVIIDVIVIYPNENTSAETQASHDESASDSSNSGLVTVGKTYAEAVINKKELIKEIEEERKRQEVNLFCLISTRAPQDTTDNTSESNVNMTEDERKDSGNMGIRNVNLYYGSENSVSDGKTLVQSVGSNPSKIICIMENNNASVVESVSDKSSNEVGRSRGEVLSDSVLEGHTDDEFKDETDEQDRQERRKNLKSYSVSLTTLNLASPGKALTQAPPPKPNTILNKISTIINNDNTNNINPVNTLFSVLSLTTSSSHSYSLHPSNSSSPSNSTSTFGNESSSFNSTYTNSKLLSDNNKNYYFNNIHNNYKPVNNTTGSFTSNKTQSNSSGNLQKLNSTHNPKSVKRHGSLNSISNYGGTNFPGCNSPLKQKMKNSVVRGGVRECVSRGTEGGSNPAEDTLLQSDELHTQYSAKIRTFVELKDSITGLLKAMKQSREFEQQHLRQVRRLWKELLAQKIDAISAASKKKEEMHPPIHASILSKINLNNNQKAGLIFLPRHGHKSNMELGSRSPNRSRSSTQGSKEGSSGTPCTTSYNGTTSSQSGNLYHNSGALSPALLALSMYNYVPSLSPKPGDVLSEEDISGFGSHSRFSYSLSSINGSHNNSHNSLQSLSSANGAAVCISDKYNETEIMLDPKDKAVSSHVVECVGDLRVLVKEEVLAREKLEALKLLLDSTNQVGLQLQSFESIGNKSEHSISSSQKSNQSNSRASYNSSSEKATKSINHDNDNEINQNNSHYRMNEISDMYNNSNTVNNSINITGTGAGSVKIGSHSSNNNSSNDECSINTNNNSSNHSSNSSIHRSTDIRSSRSIQRTHAPEGDDSSTGNMKTSLHDDGLIAIDSSRSRFNT